MTFLLERPHPGFALRSLKPKQSTQWGLLSLLPFEIEVAIEERGNYAPHCDCGTVYRIAPNGVRWLMSREVLRRGLSARRRPVICSCMGQVVEKKGKSA